MLKKFKREERYCSNTEFNTLCSVYLNTVQVKYSLWSRAPRVESTITVCCFNYSSNLPYYSNYSSNYSSNSAEI